MNKPALVAFYNFVFPGLGYIVLQKRIVFGWMLLAASLISLYVQFTEHFATMSAPGATLSIAAFLLASSAFAYDAYQLAKE